MNLKKNLGRIAATLLSTAMLASVAAVPAFAEDTYNGVSDKGTQYENGQELTDLTFKKVLKLPENVPVPTVEFEFTLSGAEAEEGEQVRGTRPGQSTSVDVVTGEGSVSGTASFNKDSATTETEKEGVVQTETVVNIPLNELKFDNVGAYKFTLHEDAVAGNFADSGEYTVSQDSTVYLYVERTTDESTGAEDYIVTGVVMLQPGKTYSATNKSDGKLTNTYLLDENGDPKTNELTVAKQVEGAMGNRSKEFEFNVKIISKVEDGDEQTVGKTYKAVYEVWSEAENAFVVDNTKEPVVFTAEQYIGPKDFKDWAAEQTFMLAHNERIHVYGISANDQCQIKETKSGGYDVTYKSNTKDAEGKVYKYPNNSLTGIAAYLSDIKDGADAINMTFINTRNAVSPTGLVMDIAPYALLVVVAAAGCFIFMRKRRED